MNLPFVNYHSSSNQDAKLACLTLYEWAMQHNLRSVQLVISDDQYYKKTYEERRDILKAPSIQYLCKTIVFQNTAYDQKFKDPLYPKNIVVIVQYVAKIHTEKLTKEVRKLFNNKIPKQYYHFRLANEEISTKLTGYQHNGVVPILMKTSMPLFISDKIQSLKPQCFWLGGGHPWVKIRLSFKQFISSYPDLINISEITY